MKRLYYETETETRTVKKKGYIEVDDQYTQIYDSLSRLTFKMKSLTEVQLMFFFCINSNDHGIFSSNERSYLDFIRYTKANQGAEISKVTFFNSIKNLADNKIFIKLNRGQYQLNPFLIWRDSLNERTDAITLICESEDKIKYQLNETN